MLEEEIAARRSYWRRQRKREDELSALETELVQILFADENVSIEPLKEKLENADESL